MEGGLSAVARLSAAVEPPGPSRSSAVPPPGRRPGIERPEIEMKRRPYSLSVRRHSRHGATLCVSALGEAKGSEQPRSCKGAFKRDGMTRLCEAPGSMLLTAAAVGDGACRASASERQWRFFLARVAGRRILVMMENNQKQPESSAMHTHSILLAIAGVFLATPALAGEFIVRVPEKGLSPEAEEPAAEACDGGEPEQAWSFQNENRVSGLDVDTNGNVYAAIWNDGAVRKISSDGEEAEVNRDNDTSSFDVARDPNGNLYVGTSNDTIIKIKSDGLFDWEKNYFSGFVFAVVVDSNGNAVGASADDSVRQIKPDGSLEWSFHGHTDTVREVVADKDGNVYTASYDGTVFKVDSAGDSVWQSKDLQGRLFSVDMDSDGNLFVGDEYGVLHKLDSEGNKIWEQSIHDGIIWDIDVDANGNVYTASHDETVKKTSPDGNQDWTFSESVGMVQAVAVNAQGSVFAGGDDAMVRKINQVDCG